MGERLSGYVEWYENTKEGGGCGEECGFESSWIIGPGVGAGTWGLLEYEPGNVSWCQIMEALAKEVLQNYL